jgi:hypothetical protein
MFKHPIKYRIYSNESGSRFLTKTEIENASNKFQNAKASVEAANYLSANTERLADGANSEFTEVSRLKFLNYRQKLYLWLSHQRGVILCVRASLRSQKTVINNTYSLTPKS